MLNNCKAKIADLGFALDNTIEKCKYFYNVGTTNYMSPEAI